MLQSGDSTHNPNPERLSPITCAMAMLRKLIAQERRISYPGRIKMLITKSATAQAAAIPVVSFTTSHHSGRL